MRVLVVDDSAVVRTFLTHILESSPDIQVVGTAADGEEAVARVEALTPDVVTMDINMPKLNGYEATQQIMQTMPVPVVIVSGTAAVDEVSFSMRALEAGALTVLPRPRGIGHPEHAEDARKLVRTVRLMSEVQVVRRWARPKERGKRPPAVPGPQPGDDSLRVVAMGASTGGPQVVQGILAQLSRPYPLPILVVQHMASGFIKGFVDWLNATTALPVKVAPAGEVPRPGMVYVAPDEHCMVVGKTGGIRLIHQPHAHGPCPCVAHLFGSVADYHGARAVGVLLSGMGKDGAAELLRMRERGALTLAQDAETSIVFGMPGAAVALGAARHVAAPEAIAARLNQISVRA